MSVASARPLSALPCVTNYDFGAFPCSICCGRDIYRSSLHCCDRDFVHLSALRPLAPLALGSLHFVALGSLHSFAGLLRFPASASLHLPVLQLKNCNIDPVAPT